MFLVFFPTFRKRRTTSTPSNQSAAAEKNSRDNFQTDSEYSEIPETVHSYENTPRMYTTPIVKKYENFPQNTRGNIINTSRDI